MAAFGFGFSAFGSRLSLIGCERTVSFLNDDEGILYANSEK